MTAKKTPASVALLDLEQGVSLRAGSNTAAVLIARELCPESVPRPERVALYEFLVEIAYAVRWEI